MSEVTADDRGRITIPKELRERHGDRYRLVELADGIKLLPRPEDPVATLRNAGSEELKGASMDDLREAARLQAHEAADDREPRDRQ
jgi:bifunctional DNA-binding transcriptional regulator/antitoxin component of YhaV-PrlF toxin-antitoxin module